MNRQKIKSLLFAALEESGKLMKATLHQRKIVAKKSELSLVTATDQKIEEMILKRIAREFPDHAILAEESPPQGNSTSRWIIDPLDGTTNFAHAYPQACTSIAYEEKGEVLIGGVYDPFREELFFAEKGKGAKLNGKKIRVSPTRKLSDSLLCTGFPYDRRERADEYLAIFKAFLMKAQGLRRLGAAALDLCYVACGRFDGYWELKLNPWDKAAAILVIKEAGGRSSNFRGETLTLLDDIQNVASNSWIYEEMLRVLKPFCRIGKDKDL